MNIDRLAFKIANGDEKAFEDIYNALNKLVFSVCYGITKNSSDSADLTQETFVSVWQHISEYKGGSFKYWILTIAKNKSLNFIKKSNRQIDTENLENSEDVSINHGVDIETRLTIYQALERLDATDRQIVLLRNSGMKMKDIAAYLGMPRGTVSWKYKEALENIKKFIKGEL